jgi:hypothetical protein
MQGRKAERCRQCGSGLLYSQDDSLIEAARVAHAEKDQRQRLKDKRQRQRSHSMRQQYRQGVSLGTLICIAGILAVAAVGFDRSGLLSLRDPLQFAIRASAKKTDLRAKQINPRAMKHNPKAERSSVSKSEK